MHYKNYINYKNNIYIYIIIMIFDLIRFDNKRAKFKFSIY